MDYTTTDQQCVVSFHNKKSSKRPSGSETHMNVTGYDAKLPRTLQYLVQTTFRVMTEVAASVVSLTECCSVVRQKHKITLKRTVFSLNHTVENSYKDFTSFFTVQNEYCSTLTYNKLNYYNNLILLLIIY